MKNAFITIRLASLVLMLSLYFGVETAKGAVFVWSGAGGDGEWTTATNWDLDSGGDDGSNGYPDLTDEARPVGGAAINVTGALTVNRIYWVGGDDAINGVNITGDQLTITEFIRKDRQGDLDISNDINADSIFSQNSNLVGNIKLRGVVSGTSLGVRNGPTELFSSNTYDTNAVFLGGSAEVVLRNANALGPHSGTWELAGDSIGTISLATHATFNGSLRVTNAAAFLNFRIADSGTADRTFTVKGGTLNHAGTMQFVANEAGSTGDLTLHWLREAAGTNSIQLPLITLSNSIVELDTAVSGANIVLADEISGDGKVVKSGPGTANVQVAQTYTGGTDINAGLVQLETDFTGSLPDTGEVKIATGATLKLNGLNDTIGSLSGTGTVDLDSATLLLSKGIRPGSSAGTLVIEDAGTLQLQGTSFFELGPLAGPNDLVQLTDGANLELGGNLQVNDLGGLGVGLYQLFDLNGGTISGSFDTISVQGGLGSIQLIGGDVYLNVLPVPEPSSALLVCFGILGWMQYRRRQR